MSTRSLGLGVRVSMVVAMSMLSHAAMAQPAAPTTPTTGPATSQPPPVGAELPGSLPPEDAVEPPVDGPPPAPLPPPAPAPPPVTVIVPVPAPAPAPSAPAAPPLPPGMRQVWVHIDSDAPGTELKRHLRRHDDGRRWHTACYAPCDTFVSTYDDTHFRFDGPGITGSGKFEMGPIGYGRWSVESGSSAQWVMGWVTVGVGGAAFATGIAMLALSAATAWLGGNEGLAIAGAATTLGGVGVGVGLGLPLLLTARTRFELYDAGPLVGVTANGLRIDF